MESSIEDVPLSIDDFYQSNCQQIAEHADKDGYYGLYKAFLDAAEQAYKEGFQRKGKCLSLISNACSMMLSPGKFNEPFKPLMVFNDRRTALPEDFQKADIEFFALILDEVNDDWLKGRLADLLWLLSRPREVKYALLAIDSYMKLPLRSDAMVREGRESWERAIYLCKNLRNIARERFVEIEEILFAHLDSTGVTDGFLAFWIADLLGLTRYQSPADIAQKLETLAKDFDLHTDYDKAEKYFSRAATWFERDNNKSKSADMTMLVAEMIAKQGFARISSRSNPSHMVGMHFFEKAIQVYRTIPKAERPLHDVDKRVAHLYEQLANSGEMAIDEMSVITSESIDITEMVEEARDSVRDKSELEALSAFWKIHPGIRADYIREVTEKQMRDNPLMSIFSSSHISGDGRVVAKTPGLTLSEISSERDEAAIFSAMIKNYSIEIGFIVQGRVMPALQVIQLQHRFSEADFIEICNRAPVVPLGNEILLGKALFAGFESDFVSALHILVPQVENLVRVHLKRKGAKTTTLDAEGIQTENGLSTLVDLPEMVEVFGENLTFEVKALFCSSQGPNIRNQLAHGLLTYEACHSYSSVYAWWLWVRIILSSFFHASEKA